MDAVVYRARVEGVLSGEDMVGMRLRLDCFVCCGGGYWPLISANDQNNETVSQAQVASGALAFVDDSLARGVV